MRDGFLKFCVVVFVAALGARAVMARDGGITAPALRNPLGRGTAPPSSSRGGLIRTPNPMNRTGELVVTGHVGGGRHFRGLMPYNVESDFSGNIGGLSPLDSFLRRSAGSGDFGRYEYIGQTVPYYSETGTVTSIPFGTNRIARPPNAMLDTRIRDDISIPPLNRPLTGRDLTEPVTGLKSITLMSTDEDIERLRKRVDIDEFFQQRREDRQAKLRESLKESDGPSLLLEELKLQDRALPVESQRPPVEEDTGEQRQRPEEKTRDLEQDIFEQMQLQIQETLQQPPVQSEEEEQVTSGDRRQPSAESAPGDLAEKITSATSSENRFPESSEAVGQEALGLEKYSKSQISAMARAVMAPQTSFASYSDDKFNGYMAAAEQYLANGNYYRAAEAYELASVYKPSDPLAYAGRGHALLAAGQYVSSGLFLSRAIEIFPEYALFKIDLAKMLGGPDVVETRTGDLLTWLARSDAAELHFLLAYIYYHTNRQAESLEAIEKAAKKAPSSPAIQTLKKAISSHGQ